MLAGANVGGQSGAVGLSQVSTNNKHWVAEALSLSVEMEVR